VLLIIAGCSSSARRPAVTDANTDAETDAEETALSAAPASSAPTSVVAPSGLGTLTVTVGAPAGQTASRETLRAAATTLLIRLAAVDDPTILIRGDTLIASLPHVAESTSPDVVWPGTRSAVYLRPVSYCYTPTPDPTTTTGDRGNDPAQAALLPTSDGQLCQVGPSRGDATVFEPGSAAAELSSGQWGVSVALRTGETGEGMWNALAAECFEGSELCPSHQLAIELYGVIQSAPTVNAPTFAGNVQITGAFTEAEATALANAINAGTDATALTVIESTFTPDD